MTALKAADVNAFLAKPNPKLPIVLVYGPDIGLVSERVEALVKHAVDDPRDPFSLARLDGDALAETPERLVEEAHTIPLFGGRRAVWVKAGNKTIASAVEALIAAPPAPDCRVVIEAGDLKRNAPLRMMCEKSKDTAVIACYADEGRGLGSLIDDEMRQSGLTIAPEARALLVSLVGGDRLASRNEIRKLALYVHGRERVEVDDVFEVVADASALALDGVVDAAFAGKPQDVETQFAKARGAGTHPNGIAIVALRQAAQLHRARLAFDTSGSIDEAIGGMYPSVHFRRKDAVEAALRTWPAARLEKLMAQFAEVVLDSRRHAELAETIVQRALLSTAQSARRKA